MHIMNIKLAAKVIDHHSKSSPQIQMVPSSLAQSTAPSCSDNTQQGPFSNALRHMYTYKQHIILHLKFHSL